MRTLRVVDSLRVVRPCSESWEAMRDGAHGRHCAKCDVHVHDVAGMTEREVLGWVALSNGAFCARLTYDERGALVHAPEPLARSSPSRAGVLSSALASAGLALAPAVALANVVIAPSAVPSAAQPATPQPAPGDRDGDGFADAVDACPDQASGTHPDPARTGCPAFIHVVHLGGAETPVAHQVYFDLRSATPRARSLAVLTAVAEALQRAPELRRVVIEGHADVTEQREARGRDLGQRRADAVLERLVALGVDRARLATRSFADGRPIVMGHGPVQRARNRRVEFRVER